MKAINSAITIDTQIPSTSNRSGKMTTADIWNTNVLKKEMSADTSPLFSAVKNEEPNIAIPANRKEKANIEKALTVKLYRLTS